MKARNDDAFTLVELLTVMAVMVALIALIAPSTVQVMRGSNLTQSGELVGDQISFARQAALTGNRRVQVRFYQLPVASPDNANNYAAMQCFRVEDSGAVTPLTKLQTLSTKIIFASDSAHSTLLSPPTGATLSVSGKDTLPAYGTMQCSYVGFQFMPDGSTDLDPTPVAASGGWFITLVEANLPVPTGQPKNFYTLRVEPFDGGIRLFRP